MKCAVCQTENREGAKFCAKCGGAMGAAAVQADAHSNPCPACHHPCKPDAKFCPKCGHNFAAQKSAEPVIQQAAAMAPAGEALACPSCGSAVKADAKFCLKCGYSLSKAPAQQAPVPPPATDATTPPPSFNLGMQNTVSPVPTAQERAARGAPAAAAKKFPTLAVALGVAGLVLVIGIAAFVMHQKRQAEAGDQTNSEAAQSASALPEAPALAAKPAVASVAPAPEHAPQPAAESAAPATLPSPAPAPAAQAPLPAAPVAVPTPAAPKVAITKPAAPQPDAEKTTILNAVNDSLNDGAKCMQLKKFDCAIANANAVLRISPNNARALEMKRKAKAEQEKALSQINIE